VNDMSFDENALNSGADRAVAFYGQRGAANVFIQPVDEHDAGLMDSEAALLKELSGREDWCIVTYPVLSWNTELTPWENPPVFGNESFGSGAKKTLEYIVRDLIPQLDRTAPSAAETERRYYLCGYSLAGLFALWSAYQTDAFAGIAAVSPSVWYPGWSEYASEHTVRAGSVYLSLGLKEEKTRNRVMAAVGDAIRRQYGLLANADVKCVLEWNEGNHFVDSDLRTARGMAWLLKQNS